MQIRNKERADVHLFKFLRRKLPQQQTFAEDWVLATPDNIILRVFVTPTSSRDWRIHCDGISLDCRMEDGSIDALLSRSRDCAL